MSETVRTPSVPALPRLPRWRPCDRKTRVLVGLVFVPALLLALTIYTAIISELLGPPARYAEMLYLFWSWSAFLHAHAGAAIYDPQALHAFEHARIAASAHSLPFAYPPSMLLLLWPLALLPPAGGVLAWLSASLAAIVWASWDRREGRGWSATTAIFAVIAPSTLAVLYFGQVTLLVASCIIGGWRLIDRHPVLAGVLFGLAAAKPQFGLLIPIALVSGRYWRSILAAALTVALTVVASGAAFGWTAWTGLPAALGALGHFAARIPRFDDICPTVAATLRVLGFGPHVTAVAQVLAAIGAAVAVAVAFRRGATPLAVALLMVGTFLATPYAVFYDLPMLSYAVLLVVRERRAGRDGFAAAELVVLIATVALPLLVRFEPWNLPWGILVMAALFALIIRRIVATRPPTPA